VFLPAESVSLWLSRHNFEKNVIKEDKNNDFESFYNVLTPAKNEFFLNCINATRNGFVQQ